MDDWQAIPQQGYLLTFGGAASERPHQFCGPNDIPGAECPNCKKPFLRLATFHIARLPFELPTKVPQIHLLYCWTCAVPFGEFSYRLTESGGVEVLEVLDEYPDQFGPEGPYDGYTGVFPAKNVGLRPVTAEEEQRAREAASDPVHQVGGYAMIYNPGPVECTECGEHSPFFATIADSAVGQKSERDEKKTFTGNCGVQMVFHFCTACSVIAAYHSVD